jgi:hypothetical protein
MFAFSVLNHTVKWSYYILHKSDEIFLQLKILWRVRIAPLIIVDSGSLKSIYSITQKYS